MEHIVHVRISLPPVFDEDGTRLQIQPFDHPFYAPQLEREDVKALFEGKRDITANAFEITERGLTFSLDKGIFTNQLERFDEAVQAAGLQLPLSGAAAVIGLQALSLALARLTRTRGERGAGKAKMIMHDVLLADILARLSRGISWRQAARDTLDKHAEHFADLPIESALIKFTQRALTRSRSKPAI